jgi:hypothetical protein
MIRLLEKIARDEEANPTSRVTAIRALRLFPEPLPLDESLYPPNNVLPMSGPAANRRRRMAEE